MNYEMFFKSYWQYYLELEQHFLETERYVSFEERNNSTYSIEYVKLLQAICSEIDVVGKEIAKYNNSNFNLNNSSFKKWCYELMLFFPVTSKVIVSFDNENKLQPWKSVRYVKFKDGRGNTRYKLEKNSKTPKWWSAYNKVKHERTTIINNQPNYTKANLLNVKTALAALYIIEVLMINELNLENKEFPKSKLFRIIENNGEASK